MPIYRPGYVMAAIYQDDESELTFFERIIYRLLSNVVPYKLASRERWLFGQRAALEMHRDGIEDFLIPGAGVPTSGHVHQLLPEARVLYIDNDLSIVKAAQKMLVNKPRVRYIYGDLTRWDEVKEQCNEFFDLSPRIGIIFVGASYFIPDEPLRNLLKDLYDWAGPGSKIVIDNYNSEFPMPPARRIFHLVYELTGNHLYLRNDAEFRELLEPWQIESTRPIIYGIPYGFAGEIKLPDDLTEDDSRKAIPIWVGYKASKVMPHRVREGA